MAEIENSQETTLSTAPLETTAVNESEIALAQQAAIESFTEEQQDQFSTQVDSKQQQFLDNQTEREKPYWDAMQQARGAPGAVDKLRTEVVPVRTESILQRIRQFGEVQNIGDLGALLQRLNMESPTAMQFIYGKNHLEGNADFVRALTQVMDEPVSDILDMWEFESSEEHQTMAREVIQRLPVDILVRYYAIQQVDKEISRAMFGAVAEVVTELPSVLLEQEHLQQDIPPGNQAVQTEQPQIEVQMQESPSSEVPSDKSVNLAEKKSLGNRAKELLIHQLNIELFSGKNDIKAFLDLFSTNPPLGRYGGARGLERYIEGEPAANEKNIAEATGNGAQSDVEGSLLRATLHEFAKGRDENKNKQIGEKTVQEILSLEPSALRQWFKGNDKAQSDFAQILKTEINAVRGIALWLKQEDDLSLKGIIRPSLKKLENLPKDPPYGITQEALLGVLKLTY